MPKVILAAGSSVFKTAFGEEKGEKRKKKQKVSTNELVCEHKDFLRRADFTELSLDTHRSFQVTQQFFDSFTPFSDVNSIILMENINQWLSFAHEFAIEYIIQICRDKSQKFLNYLLEKDAKDGVMGVEALQLVTLLGALERFFMRDLYEFSLQTLAQLKNLSQVLTWMEASPHFQCCISKTILTDLLKIKADLKQDVIQLRVGNVYEALDNENMLCLVRVLEVSKKEEVKVHYLGWSNTWNTTLHTSKLSIPRVSNICKYRRGISRELEDEFDSAIALIKTRAK